MGNEVLGRRLEVVRACVEAAKEGVAAEKALEYERGTIEGVMASRDKAKEKMKKTQGKVITSKDGIEATLGINSINNIVSGAKILKSTRGKNFNIEQYLAVVADIENLFRNSIRVLTHPDYRNDVNMKAIHNFITPLFGNNIAFITIKESVIEGKKVYNIELLEIGELDGKIREVISKTTHQTASNSPFK